MNIIKCVTTEGISYIDCNGVEGFVDFKQCNENWIQHRKRKENLSDDNINEIRKDDKCIGQRDVCASTPFIELFTNPFTRFAFIMSDEYPEPIEAFRKLKEQIMNAGWTTLDFS